MKTKFFSVLAILIGLIISPAFSITDEELIYQGLDVGDIIHPVSLEPDLLKGHLTNQTIVNTFFEDLGEVVFQILDENNQPLITKRTRAFAGGNFTIDIASLAQGNYKIYCFIPNETVQVAHFQVLE